MSVDGQYTIPLKQACMIILTVAVVFSALKSHGKSATFRQHYYPEGGWGWVITFCCFVVNIFTTGLQLSFSVLSLQILRLCGPQVREDKISVGEFHGSDAALPAGCYLRLSHVL